MPISHPAATRPRKRRDRAPDFDPFADPVPSPGDLRFIPFGQRLEVRAAAVREQQAAEKQRAYEAKMVRDSIRASHRMFIAALGLRCPVHEADLNRPCWTMPRAVCGRRAWRASTTYARPS